MKEPTRQFIVDTFQWISFLGLIVFWIWGCQENIGLIAIGVPVVIFAWAASTGGSSGGSNEPRIGPFGGDG